MQTNKKKFAVHKYTVVLFEEEEDEKLFECIPDIWFVDELRERCFFPPKTGRSYIQRAINCEKPEDNWGIFECKIVKDGFLTYHAGFKIVREKCEQRYNTSSADDEINLAKYRREHPALIGESIEHIFLKPKTTLNASGRAEKTVNKSTIVNDAVGKNLADALNNTNTNETASKNNVVNDTEDNPDIGIPPKQRKIEHLKESVESSGNHRSCSKDARLSHHRSSDSSSCQKQQRNSRSHSNSDTSSASSRRQRTHSRTNSKQNKNSRTRSSSASSRSSDQRSSSRSGSTKSRESHSRSNSRQLRNSRSRSNSVRSSLSSLQLPVGSRSSSRQPRNSRSRSNSVQSSLSDLRLSAGSRSSSRQPRNSRSRSNSVQSSLSDLRLSAGSRSSSRQPRNSRSRSNSVQSSLSSLQLPVGSQSSRRQPRNSGSSSKRSNHLIRHENSHSVSIQPRSSQHSRRHTENIGSKTSYNHERSRYKQKGYQENGKKSKANTNVVTDRENKVSVSDRNASGLNNHQSPHAPTSSSASVKQLIASVNELTKAVKRNNDHLAKNDRRLTRLEVTVNKIFITVGDMNGNNRFQDEADIDPDIIFPDLPIVTKTGLYKIHRQLKDKEFHKIWLNNERNFCCPTKTSTDTVTITKYLKRFVSLNVRCQLTLKEPGESGLTLHKDYHRVYLFLVDVMKEGYRICGKKITVDEAHTALRVVWGRSKQLQNNIDRN